MRKVRKEIAYLTGVFLLLCIFSAYWKTSKRLFPAEPVRPVVIYLVYVSLLAMWWVTIQNRVTQRNMRVFLSASNLCMLIGMTVRYMQEAFWHHFFEGALTSSDTFIMRFSGYCTCIAFILIPVFGLYASFGLGKTEEYRFNRYWYYLLVPAVVLVIMVLTNDLHHLAFLPLQDETDFFRYYRPHIGLYLIITWAFLLLLIRIFILQHKSRESGRFTFSRLVPLLFTVMVILVNIPYITSSFMPKFELMEQEALLFFLEIVVWESCIIVGMVPVNIDYDKVFDQSTVAMLIIDNDGKLYLESSGASVVSTETLLQLKERSPLRTPQGLELHLHPISGGYAIWQRDVSQTIAVIEELEQTSERLEQEAVLLRQEIAAKSDEAAVKEQNRIYNQLTEEIGEQLSLLRNLLEKRERVGDKAMLFQKICLIGTYVKRRCNLRLIEQSEKNISKEELQLCYAELIGFLLQMGIEAELVIDAKEALLPDFALFTFDLFEFILEHEGFELLQIKAIYEADGAFSLFVQLDNENEKQPLLDGLHIKNAEIYDVKWHAFEDGYQIVVR